MSAERALALDDVRDDFDHIVHLHDVSWDDYLRVLRMRGDHSAPRIAYLEGELEIMSPSRYHEAVKSLAGLLIASYCLEHDIVFTPYGSWTLKKRPAKRGAEPDECYVFGDVEEPTRPDLAIEVVWTSGRIDKLEIYRKLGVREVWYWRAGKLQPYLLKGERYRPIARSKVLAGIDLEELAKFMGVLPASRAIREYRAALTRRKPTRSKSAPGTRGAKVARARRRA